jgi:hypothetical protein
VIDKMTETEIPEFIWTGSNLFISQVHADLDTGWAVCYNVPTGAVREAFVDSVILTDPPLQGKIIPYPGYPHECLIGILCSVRLRMGWKDRDLLVSHV